MTYDHNDILANRKKTGITNADRPGWGGAIARVYGGSTDGYEEDVICDLVADLMHYAEMMGQDALEQIKRAIYHWYAEKNDEAATEISISITGVYR